MRTIYINKAGAAGVKPVESVTIIIDVPIPDGPTGVGWYEASVEYHEKQADAIVDAFSALPQGTAERVLAKMLNRAAGICRIPWWDVAKERAEVTPVAPDKV